MKKVSLIALNPMNVISTNLYLLKEYANKDKRIADSYNFILHFFDSLIPDQSNAIDLIIRQIIDDESEIVGFSTFCWNVGTILKCAEIIKKVKPSISIFLGGPEATGNADNLLKKYRFIDCIIAGEGEIAFKEYLLYKIGLIKKNGVANLVYLECDQTVHNEEKMVTDLDEIPALFSSGAMDVNLIGEKLYSFETLRGCQYKCSYCFHHKGCHMIRKYSLKRIFAELDMLLSSKTLKYIWIIDPCFNDDEERSIQIIRHIVENNVNQIEFGFEIRNETMSELFIEEMSKLSNIKFVAMGLQTTQKESLEAVHRELNIQKFEENIKLVKKYFDKDISIHVDLIFGLPNNNIKIYKEDINYVLGMGCEIFTQPLKILPGTDLAKETEKYGFVVNDEPPYEIVCNSSFSYEDMCEAKKINAMLNLFQASDYIRNIVEQICKKQKMKYADVFQELGDYFWRKGATILFTNYVSVEEKELVTLMQNIVKDVYGINCTVECTVENELQLDWGSVAKQQKYSIG